jgi:uncharacterized protein (DUF1684 family)
MRRAALIALLLAWFAAQALAADAPYAEEITKWRGDFDADVRQGGWLTFVNRVQLSEGLATVGSDPRCTVRLPSRAPKRLGTISRMGRTFQFEPAPGLKYLLDGKTVEGRVELSTKSETGRVQVGAIRVRVRGLGEDFYALVTDDENSAIASFKGTSWFPIDPSWRVSAHFVAYLQAETVAVPMTHVTSKTTMRSTGDVVFELKGQSVRLKTFIDEDHLFVMFTDPTNGHETYGGGRFLDAPMPKDGVSTLDFNKAYNPYCSVNEFVMCPIVPSSNQLGVPVVAGEKFARAD